MRTKHPLSSSARPVSRRPRIGTGHSLVKGPVRKLAALRVQIRELQSREATRETVRDSRLEAMRGAITAGDPATVVAAARSLAIAEEVDKQIPLQLEDARQREAQAQYAVHRRVAFKRSPLGKVLRRLTRPLAIFLRGKRINEAVKEGNRLREAKKRWGEF